MAIQFVMTAEDKNVSAALQKMATDMVKLREEHKKLSEESKKGAHESKAAHEALGNAVRDQVGELGHMAAGLFTVNKAADFVKEAYSQWAEKMREAAREHKAFMRDVIKDLAQAGELAEGGKITKAFGSVPHATREQAAQSFSGISGEARDMPLEGRLALMREATRTSVLGLDQKQFGAHAGVMAQMFPGKSANDIADITLQSEALLGSDASTLSDPKTLSAVSALKATGAISPEESIGLMAAAKKNRVPPAVLHELADFVTKKHEKRKPTGAHGLSEEDAAFNKLVGLSPRDQIHQIMRDRSIAQAALGSPDAARIGVSAAGDATQKIKNAGPQDFIAQQIDAMGGFTGGAQEMADHRIKLQADIDRRMIEFHARKSERASQFLDSVSDRRKLSPVQWAAKKTWFETFGAVGMSPEGRLRKTVNAETPEFEKNEQILEAQIRAAAAAERTARATEQISRRRNAPNTNTHVEQ